MSTEELQKFVGLSWWKWFNGILDRDDDQTALADIVYRKCGGK